MTARVTLLLDRITQGDPNASSELLPLVYAQLRSRADAYFRSQRSGHTLQPTALVHEAYLKLVNTQDSQWRGREHFLAAASTAMRHVLHDHARAKMTQKRSAPGERVHLTQIESPSKSEAIDIIALDEALTHLAEADEQGARIVEMRYFGGLSIDESARVLGVSTSTVDRAWRRCRAWIRLHLADSDDRA